MIRTVVTLLGLALIIMFALSSWRLKRSGTLERHDYAVFFAVNDYAPGSGFDDLHKPIENAEAIARELKTHYGFDTVILRNPTRQQITQKLEEYKKLFETNRGGAYTANGQLLIFFTGHGYSEDENGYFIPANGYLSDLTGTAIAYNVWRSKINLIKCNHIMVAIDACRSVSFHQGWYNRTMGIDSFYRPGELLPADRLIKDNQDDSDFCRLAFTSDGYDDDVPERSNFARKFLEILRQGPEQGGVLSSSDVEASLKYAFPKPRCTYFGDDRNGSFLFVPVNLYNSSLNEDTTLAPAESFVTIPAGRFSMGDNHGEDNELPTHWVTIDSFFMMKREVTNAEFCRFLNAKGNRKEGVEQWINLQGNYEGEACRIVESGEKFSVQAGYEQHPVIFVSWHGARAYCDWLTEKSGGKRQYRLPTEAEWEYAACGGALKDDKWAGTSEEERLSRYANFCDSKCDARWKTEGQNDKAALTTRAGSYQPNRLGVYDLTGNVWEWCADWYAKDYYAKSPNENPKGPAEGKQKMMRGGSWISTPENCRTTSRVAAQPGLCKNDLGFRVVRSVNGK